jgi:hypothetical protein
MKHLKSSSIKLQPANKSETQSRLTASSDKIRKGKFSNLRKSLLDKFYSLENNPSPDKEFKSGNFGPLNFGKQDSSKSTRARSTIISDIKNIENLQNLKINRCLFEQIEGKILVIKCKHALFGEIEIKAELHGNKPVIQVKANSSKNDQIEKALARLKKKGKMVLKIKKEGK